MNLFWRRPVTKMLALVMILTITILTLPINANQDQTATVNIVDSGNNFMTVCRNQKRS